MDEKKPTTSVAILVVKNNQILLGLLTKKWMVKNTQVYGLLGRDIFFGESIAATVKRIIREEISCTVKTHKVFCVNANYEMGNHYIEIGVLVDINGEPKNLAPDDWERWEWFDTSNMPGNLFPSAASVIDCYLQNKVNIVE